MQHTHTHIYIYIQIYAHIMNNWFNGKQQKQPLPPLYNSMKYLQDPYLSPCSPIPREVKFPSDPIALQTLIPLTVELFCRLRYYLRLLFIFYFASLSSLSLLFFSFSEFHHFLFFRCQYEWFVHISHILFNSVPEIQNNYLHKNL